MSVGGKFVAVSVALLLAGWVSYRAEAPDASCEATGPLGDRVAATAGRWVYAAVNEPAPTPKEVRREVDGALSQVVEWAHIFQAAATGKDRQPEEPRGPMPTGARSVRAAAARYFPASELDTAVAVAGAESNWRPDAVNRTNRNGSTDYGAWQINSVHADLLRGRDWSDLDTNAWMAHQVWHAVGGSWSPWTTYKSGSYKRFLAEARASVSGVPEVVPVSRQAERECDPAEASENAPSNGRVRVITDPSSGRSYRLAIPDTPGGAALSAALTHLGKPYRWGAHGPDRFDCSGLTSVAWREAGVTVYPQSLVQRRTVPSVPLSEVQPGDILWKPGHVQLYAGRDGGRVIIVEAPRTGLNVRITEQWMQPVAALRPGRTA